MLRKSLFYIVLLIVIASASCSRYQKLVKSPDNELKYEKAMEFYDKGDYYKALQLFETVLPVYRGTDKAEELYYRYAYSYYHEGEYIMAAYYFKRFYASFPSSKYAEEVSFMSAYCTYLDSPKFSLDQTNTYEAIDAFQLFINRYPRGDRAQQATEYIDELRQKLLDKAYNIGNLYYKMEDYRAAIVSYESLLKDYPDTEYKEEILYKIIKAYYEYAMKSIEVKKKERYESAVKAYLDFISLYPESEYIDDVQKMRNKVVDKLEESPASDIQ
jgi:outer membrane protein assembly factor BamD